ncbi:hypothetical protein [Selenomonas sp. AB3002]|uniref:hypothetical protein n=1 Tax=Selenomonas sp. AB3002 TaxID=1392502 RepID=UPI000495B81B
MKTSKIVVSSKGSGMAAALDEVEAFSKEMGFDKRSTLRARLLAEETMSMVRAIVEDFEADFWVESTEGCSCEMHLLAVAELDYKKRQDLIDASTEHRNEASVGIMGKVKDFIEGCMFYLGSGRTEPLGDYHLTGCVSYEEIQMWSLQQYRLCLEQGQYEGDDADELLDELEKSLVANIADDVRVSVQDNKVEMVIRKNF